MDGVDVLGPGQQLCPRCMKPRADVRGCCRSHPLTLMCGECFYETHGHRRQAGGTEGAGG